MITAEYKRNLAKYEEKRQELHAQLEAEVRSLASINEQKDSALHSQATAIEHRKKIEADINNKKDELKKLDGVLSAKMLEASIRSEKEKEIIDNANARIKAASAEIDGLTSEIEQLSEKRDNLLTISAEYDEILKSTSDLKETLAIISVQTEKANKELLRIKSESERIITEANGRKEKNEKEFAILQEYRSGLDFYAERLRKWYHDKGLKLPEEYKVENVTRPINN